MDVYFSEINASTIQNEDRLEQLFGSNSLCVGKTSIQGISFWEACCLSTNTNAVVANTKGIALSPNSILTPQIMNRDCTFCCVDILMYCLTAPLKQNHVTMCNAEHSFINVSLRSSRLLKINWDRKGVSLKTYMLTRNKIWWKKKTSNHNEVKVIHVLLQFVFFHIQYRSYRVNW